MFDVKILRRVLVNEQGSARGIFAVNLKNISEKDEKLDFFKMKISNTDIMVQSVELYENDEELQYTREKQESFVCIEVDLRNKTLSPHQVLRFNIRCKLPSLAKKFGSQYFSKETFFNVNDSAKTCAWTLEYEIIKLFNKWKIWKEMDYNAPTASEIERYSDSGKLTYNFIVEKGDKKDISFMFQERPNSKIISVITFLLGIGVNNLLKFIFDIIT